MCMPFKFICGIDKTSDFQLKHMTHLRLCRAFRQTTKMKKKTDFLFFWNIDLSDGVHKMRAPKTEAHGATSFRALYFVRFIC